MPASVGLVLTYTLIPVIATILGGVVATYRPPSPQVRSGIQHFAAGVVFAAVATELLPELHGASATIPLVIGFSLGVLLMLGIKSLLHGREHEEEHASDEASSTLIITIGVDMLIDGLLIGVGFAAGEEIGLLLTVALSIELLFLGLSVAAALTAARRPRGQTIAIVAGLALLALLGALIGATLLAGLTGGALVAVLAFGAAALLYLVTEELLTEAHEVRETPLITAMFFLGFLILFLLERLV